MTTLHGTRTGRRREDKWAPGYDHAAARLAQSRIGLHRARTFRKARVGPRRSACGMTRPWRARERAPGQSRYSRIDAMAKRCGGTHLSSPVHCACIAACGSGCGSGSSASGGGGSGGSSGGAPGGVPTCVGSPTAGVLKVQGTLDGQTVNVDQTPASGELTQVTTGTFVLPPHVTFNDAAIDVILAASDQPDVGQRRPRRSSGRGYGTIALPAGTPTAVSLCAGSGSTIAPNGRTSSRLRRVLAGLALARRQFRALSPPSSRHSESTMK